MNLDIVNKYCWDWSKETWREAYAEYCKSNMFGPKTKREYYDMVMESHRKEENKPLPSELKAQWIQGWRSAAAWAKRHGCDKNGRSLLDGQRDAAEASAAEIAERAENLAFETLRRLGEIEKSLKD